jgi:hypothetical protein
MSAYDEQIAAAAARDDMVDCRKYSCRLPAATCIARRREAQYRPQTLRFAGCGSCEQGAQIMAAAPAQAEKTTDEKGRSGGKGGAMSRKGLGDLNDALFAQLERLSKDDIGGDALALELQRTKAITTVSREIIGNARLVLEAAKAVGAGDLDKAPALLGLEHRPERDER